MATDIKATRRIFRESAERPRFLTVEELALRRERDRDNFRSQIGHKTEKAGQLTYLKFFVLKYARQDSNL